MKTGLYLFTHTSLRNEPLTAVPLRSVFLLLILFSAVSFPIGTLSEDTIPTLLLPELEVNAVSAPAVRSDEKGDIRLRTSIVTRMSRTFGEADYIRAIKNSAGVSTAGDYGSGITVNGANPSQTLYCIDGIPVIFPYRFGGIFSTFNTYHYSSMHFIPMGLPVEFPQRIGALLDFTPADGGKRPVSGAANVGLLSSSVTLRSSPSARLFITASGRISYIDQLYAGLLRSSTSYLHYRFHDLNLTAGYRPSANDTVIASVFNNSDRISYDDHHYALTSGMAWQNITAGVSWHHGGKLPVSAHGYFTGFNTRLTLQIPQYHLHAPSKIYFGGVDVIFHSKVKEKLRLKYGMQMEWGHCLPQYAWLDDPTGDFTNGGTSLGSSAQMPYNYGLYRAFGAAIFRLAENMELEAGVSAGIFTSRRFTDIRSDTERYLSERYISGKYISPIADPRVALKWRLGNNRLTFKLGRYSQYLHQVGFSDLGLASDFWLAACRQAPIQRAWTFSGRWQRPIGFAGLTLSSDIYFSWVSNQPEFRCNILEIVNTEYDPFDYLMNMKGYNMGIDLQLSRDFGIITGSIGYSYGLGRRKQSYVSGEYARDSHDPGNTVTANVMWHTGHWDLGATFRYSSGRPYTPVSALYLIGGNLAMQYGERNSARLPDYQRLDLTATYILETKGRFPVTHLINISLINAYGHRNTEMQYFIINPETGDYKLKRLNSLYRFLPSISYTLEF